MQNKLDDILAVARKSMPLVEGNAVLMRAGIGLTLLKTEEEKVEFLHAKQKRRTPSPPCQEFETYECAVRDIYQAGLTGQISRYRTPIAQRAGTSASGSPVDAEKRALSDAAKALAQLWKVSPTSSR
jgi:hypothetical protein